MKALGEKIRELRMARDISLRELAARIGVSPAFMSNVELGRRRPSDRHLKLIAAAVESSMEELKRHDSRPPLREVRQMAHRNPAYGLVFRRMVDADVQPEEIAAFLDEREQRGAGRAGQ